jgi:hypothetical protein
MTNILEMFKYRKKKRVNSRRPGDGIKILRTTNKDKAYQQSCRLTDKGDCIDRVHYANKGNTTKIWSSRQ